MFIVFPDPEIPYEDPTEAQWLERVKDFIGDRERPINIIDISKWNVNEIAAEYYSKGNM